MLLCVYIYVCVCVSLPRIIGKWLLQGGDTGLSLHHLLAWGVGSKPVAVDDNHVGWRIGDSETP
jgi:hypothetical protein